MKYRAARRLHYIDEEGHDRFVDEGDEIVGASDSKVEALLADGLVTAVKPDKAKGA